MRSGIPLILLGLAFQGSFDLLAKKSQTPIEWQEIKPRGHTLCARGEEFSFFVAEGRTDRIVIDYIGGGACWNDVTCSEESATFNDSIDDLREHHRQGVSGIYDRNNPNNPIRDWTHVIVPYCTGDIHWGSSDQTYTNERGEEFTIHHRGAENSKAVLDWVSQNLGTAERVLVTGCSAGAYGSIYWTPHIRQIFPNSHLVQFADAGIGVITEEFRKKSFPRWNATAHAPKWIPELDPQTTDWSKLNIIDIYEIVASHDPSVRLGSHSSRDDFVQTFFYEIMGGDSAQWSNIMQQTVHQTSSHVDKYRFFLSEGEEHCILPYSHFYNTSNRGRLFSDWFSSFVNGNPTVNVDLETAKKRS